MTMLVDQELCTGCATCMDLCENGAIRLNDGRAHIDPDKCTSCQTCVDVCPSGAIARSTEGNVITLVTPAEVEVIQERPPLQVETEPSHWVASGLSLLGQYFLPRLADTLAGYLEGRRSASEQRRMPLTIERTENRPFRQRRQQRRRFSGAYSERRGKNA